MSRKRRIQAMQQSERILLKSPVLTASVANVNCATNTENKSGWLAYLRNPAHWWTIGLIGLLTLGAMGAGLKYLEEDAKQQRAARISQPLTANPPNGDLLNAVNPFLEPPSPTPTPQLSKEYIYAGSRMLAVEDANANAAPPADLAVWRPSTGYWYVMGSQGSQATNYQWGLNGDVPVPGDYDSDGKTDFSIFRPSTGRWYVSNSSDGSTTELTFGLGTDVAAQADYDGDGKTDMAVFRPSTGYWYITYSSTQSSNTQQFGINGDTPTPADFDGDGKADVAVWRNSVAKFYILRSSDGTLQTIPFGHTDDKPVVGDFDGDGKADAGVWRPANSPIEQYQWQILYSSNNTTHAYVMGDPDSDKAVQNDYDGDGKVDVAIWRPSTGMWIIVQSHDNSTRQTQWGMNGDVPVPAFYRR